MGTNDDLLQLRKRIEQAKADSSRAAGAEEQLLKRLEEEFGCPSVEVAQSKLNELEQDVVEQEQDFLAALAEFKERFGYG
jgi:hypothetical protein